MYFWNNTLCGTLAAAQNNFERIFNIEQNMKLDILILELLE